MWSLVDGVHPVCNMAHAEEMLCGFSVDFDGIEEVWSDLRAGVIGVTSGDQAKRTC